MPRNREKEPEVGQQTQDETILNGGYSEKQQVLDTEARSGDLSGMKRSRGVIQDAKAHGKALEEYKSVSQQLNKLVESYMQLLEKDLHQAQKMLSDIESLRKLQQDLLDKLFNN